MACGVLRQLIPSGTHSDAMPEVVCTDDTPILQPNKLTAAVRI